MEIILKTRKLRNFLNGTSYKNSLIIMFTNFISSGFGFIFWILAAKLYSKEDVGIATALISSIGLLLLLSRFGLEQSIIRYFPLKNKSNVFSSSAIITTFISLSFGLIFILGIDIWASELSVLNGINGATYILFLVANSIISLTGISFIAIRKAELYLFQNLLMGVRVIFLPLLVFLGAMGIFGAVGVSILLSLLFSIINLHRLEVKPVLKLDMDFLIESSHFAAGSYFSGLLLNAPNMLLPILILNILGPAETANYYLAYSIASIIFIIPGSFSTSLFVEGSNGKSLKKGTVESIFAIFLLMVPAIIIVYFFGEFLLGSIRQSYIEALDLLKTLALSSFFVMICQNYFAIKKVQKDVKKLVIISGLLFIMIIGLSYTLMPLFGIIGVGYAWIISYALTSLLIGVFVKKEKWI